MREKKSLEVKFQLKTVDITRDRKVFLINENKRGQKHFVKEDKKKSEEGGPIL